MDNTLQKTSSYKSPGKSKTLIGGLLPSLAFYLKLTVTVFKAAGRAKNKNYDDSAWSGSSLEVLRELEESGLSIKVSGLEHLRQLDSPCVIIGNHMSMMETLLLPNFVMPFKMVTFVIKESLLDYPVFKHIMRSRNPVAVTRNNPRKDLKTVMTEGVDRLQKGISIIVFPQTTRSAGFTPKQFSSIGVKLAKKANVPIVPLALKTDAWTNGTILKDFGRIVPQKKVHFAFGAPLNVLGKGQEEHQKISTFISNKLTEWNS